MRAWNSRNSGRPGPWRSEQWIDGAGPAQPERSRATVRPRPKRCWKSRRPPSVFGPESRVVAAHARHAPNGPPRGGWFRKRSSPPRCALTCACARYGASFSPAGSCPKLRSTRPYWIIGDRYASDALRAAGCNAEIKLDLFSRLSRHTINLGWGSSTSFARLDRVRERRGRFLARRYH